MNADKLIDGMQDALGHKTYWTSGEVMVELLRVQSAEVPSPGSGYRCDCPETVGDEDWCHACGGTI